MAKAGKGVRTRQYNPKKFHYKTRLTWNKATDPEIAKAKKAAAAGVTLEAFAETVSRHNAAHAQDIIRHFILAGGYKNSGGKNPGAANLAQYVMAALEHTRGAHDEGGRVIHETPKAKRREFAREIWWRRGFRNPRFSPDKTAAKLVKAYGSVRGAEIAALEEKRMLVGDTKPAGRQQMAHVTAVLNALAGMPHEAVEKFYRKRGGYTKRGSAAKSRNVHLQGMGDYEGTPAGQLKPGMRIYFNYGIVYRVVAVEPAGGKSVLVTMQANDGKLYKKRYVKTREVVASSQQNPAGAGSEWVPFDVTYKKGGKFFTGVRFAPTAAKALSMAREMIAREFPDGSARLISVKPAAADPRQNPSIMQVGDHSYQVDNGHGTTLTLIRKGSSAPYFWEVQSVNARTNAAYGGRGFPGVRTYRTLKEVENHYKVFRGISQTVENPFEFSMRGGKPQLFGTTHLKLAAEAIAAGKSMGQFVRELPNMEKMSRAQLEQFTKAYAEVRRRLGGKKNPESATAAADAAYEMFHGTAPRKTKVLAVSLLDPYDSHSNLWQLGKLKSLTVGEFIEKMTGRDGDEPQGESSSAWATQIDFDENSAPDLAGEPGGRQLYIVGGQQNIERYLNKLRLDPGKNPLDCGFIYRIEYFTRKAFDRNRPVNYWHHFGEETGVQPRLIYDRTNHRLQLAGGEYVVKREGIVN